MVRALSGILLVLAACSPAPAPTPEPAPAPPAAVAPVDLKALEAAHDWQYEPGDKLNADWDAGVKALLGKMSRPDIIGAVNAAGFECIYGEGHEDYPDPAAQCTRSFATRVATAIRRLPLVGARRYGPAFAARSGVTLARTGLAVRAGLAGLRGRGPGIPTSCLIRPLACCRHCS